MRNREMEGMMNEVLVGTRNASSPDFMVQIQVLLVWIK